MLCMCICIFVKPAVGCVCPICLQRCLVPHWLQLLFSVGICFTCLGIFIIIKLVLLHKYLRITFTFNSLRIWHFFSSSIAMEQCIVSNMFEIPKCFFKYLVPLYQARTAAGLAPSELQTRLTSSPSLYNHVDGHHSSSWVSKCSPHNCHF